MSCTEQSIATLRERGMRMTPQREMVLAVLHDFSNHESVEEIFHRVQVRSASVDVSTVYRTLELLQEMQMLAVAETAGGQRRYALIGQHGDHMHLVCRRCGGEIEADAGAFRVLAAEVQQRYGFTLDLAHRSLDGVCAACAVGQPHPSRSILSEA